MLYPSTYWTAGLVLAELLFYMVGIRTCRYEGTRRAGDCEEGVSGFVAGGAFVRELETELVDEKAEAAIEVENPLAGVDVLRKSSPLKLHALIYSGLEREEWKKLR